MTNAYPKIGAIGCSWFSGRDFLVRSIGLFAANATAVASVVFTWMLWPSGEMAAGTIFCATALLPMAKMSYTRKPPGPSAT